MSETVDKTMNPTFRHVDLSACGPGITRLEKVAVRVWFKSVKVERWKQLLDLELDLMNLQYLGKTVRLYKVTPPGVYMLLLVV